MKGGEEERKGREERKKGRVNKYIMRVYCDNSM